jgi:large subunit ribosomal protein L25
LHADLYEVNLNERITVSVPLRFVGKASGVVLGGILQPILREIELECLPMDIPEAVQVDVSALGIHEAVHVGDIQLPPGVTARADAGQTVVTVLPPTVEEAKAAAEAPEVAPVEGAPAGGAAAPPAGEAAGGGKKGAGE